MASPSNTNTSGNTNKDPNPETTSNHAGSPHDSSNAGIADTVNPPIVLQPVIKEGSSPPRHREIYKIPRYSSWFAWDKIHSTERRFLTEFFDEKSAAKTPKVYKEYRDFIINRYRENPHKRINFTEVRKMLVGDVNSIRRVFDFLDNWGLINYQVTSSKQHTKAEENAGGGGVKVAAARVLGQKGLAASEGDRPPGGTAIDSTVIDGKDKKSVEWQSGLLCNSCGADCSIARFDCLKEVVNPKSKDEGLSKEPGNSSGTNDCSVEGVKTIKQDPEKELPITTMEEEPKDEKGDETNKDEIEQNDNKDKMLRKTDKLLRCPRCDSSGTKFCYYNNYNVNQPRHFCKDCQRYWTVGGTMRNVPVGAGRRKNKHSGTHYWHTMKSDGLTPARAGAFDAAHHSGFVLCPKCYESGIYGLGLSASDFKRVEFKEVSQHKSVDWTDEETLLLLEAIFLHNDDWKCVAQHVGTKSELDCVSRFVQLPLGEQYVGNISNEGSDRSSGNVIGENTVIKQVSSPKDSSTQEHYDHVSNDDKHTTDDVSGPPLKRRHLTPLADASNPIMGQVAFLSAMVGSHVAEAAAHAAIAALSEEDPASSLVTSTREAECQNQKNGSGASGLVGFAKDIAMEDSKKETHGGTDQTTEDGESLAGEKETTTPTVEMRAATATALESAAVRAKLLADEEDRDVENLFSTVVDSQMKKLQERIQRFEEFDIITEKERSQLEHIKDLLFADRMRFIQNTIKSRLSESKEKELEAA